MVALYILTIILFALASLLTCMMILAQESKSSGMGAAFGGESTSQVLGPSSAAILKKITSYLIVIFLCLSLILSVWTGSFHRKAMKQERALRSLETPAQEPSSVEAKKETGPSEAKPVEEPLEIRLEDLSDDAGEEQEEALG